MISYCREGSKYFSAVVGLGGPNTSKYLDQGGGNYFTGVHLFVTGLCRSSNQTLSARSVSLFFMKDRVVVTENPFGMFTEKTVGASIVLTIVVV